MTTIPARLARVTTSSGNWAVAQARSRSLYRAWYRSADEIVSLYALNISPLSVRAKIREEWERNAHVSDLGAVDVLLLKSHQDLQETLNCWKMDSHIFRWFSNEELPPRPQTFLEGFYLSRDDSKEVQPTA